MALRLKATSLACLELLVEASVNGGSNHMIITLERLPSNIYERKDSSSKRNSYLGKL